MTQHPRRFHLLRHQDISGVSGTGIVADGILWPDGTASLRWRGERPSTVHWDRMADAEAVHGHGGATEIVWLDADRRTHCSVCVHPSPCPTHPKDANAPRISPNPDGDDVILHLPDITYLDTLVWSADIGLTTDALHALRILLAQPDGIQS